MFAKDLCRFSLVYITHIFNVATDSSVSVSSQSKNRLEMWVIQSHEGIIYIKARRDGSGHYHDAVLFERQGYVLLRVLRAREATLLETAASLHLAGCSQVGGFTLSSCLH